MLSNTLHVSNTTSMPITHTNQHAKVIWIKYEHPSYSNRLPQDVKSTVRPIGIRMVDVSQLSVTFIFSNVVPYEGRV